MTGRDRETNSDPYSPESGTVRKHETLGKHHKKAGMPHPARPIAHWVDGKQMLSAPRPITRLERAQRRKAIRDQYRVDRG